MNVAQQVAIIYAVSNGFANDVEVKNMREWEIKLHAFLDKSKKVLLEKIAGGSWDEATEKELKEAIAEFKK